MTDKKSFNDLGLSTKVLEAINKKVVLRVSQEYKKLLKRRIKFSKINEESVAMHFLGLSKVKVPDDEQKVKIKKYAKLLKRTYPIDYTAYYMQFFTEKELDYRRFI